MTMIVISIAGMFFRVYVLLCLWTWAAVDVLHLQAFSYWQVFLLYVLISEIWPDRDFTKEEPEEAARKLVLAIAATASALFFGWMAHRLA